MSSAFPSSPIGSSPRSTKNPYHSLNISSGKDRPVDEIVFADYSFWNRRLAEHYGITAERLASDGFSRVDGIRRHHRGGLAGIGRRADGHLRAVADQRRQARRLGVASRGRHAGSAAAGGRRVRSRPTTYPPIELTLRRRLEVHRSSATCNNCHSRIDPLGFALEHYDPIGRWRDAYRDGQKIEASGTLNDGTTVSGPDGLRDYLRREKTQFHRTISVKLLGYALGRSELASDRPLIDVMVKRCR